MSWRSYFGQELDDFSADNLEDFSQEELEKLTWTSAKVRERLKDVLHVKQKDIQEALKYCCFDIDKACSRIIEKKHLKEGLNINKTPSKKGFISFNNSSLNKEDLKSHFNLEVSSEENASETKEVSGPKQSKLIALASSKHKLSSNNPISSSLKSVSLLSHLTREKFKATNNRENNNNSSKIILDIQTNFAKPDVEKDLNLLKTTSEEDQKEEVIDDSLNVFFKKNCEYNIEVKPSKFALTIFGEKLELPDYFYKFANQRFSLFTGVLEDDLKISLNETFNNSLKSQKKKEKKLKTPSIVKSPIYSEIISNKDDLHHILNTLNISSEQGDKDETNYDKFYKLSESKNKISNLKTANIKNKPNVNIVIIGHVDAGKSTLIGRLLYDLKVVDTETIEKLKRETNKLGKPSFHFAWVLDQTSEERDRGVTMDLGINYFETSLRRYTILDTPGHKDFIPNMIAGASQADVALLVIDASYGSFESGFTAHGQTREHVILARSLGIQKIVVAINKLETTNWSQERYEDIMAQMLQFFIYKGFQKSNISFIPCSGLTGENLTNTIPLNPQLKLWYSNFTLLDTLENISINRQQLDTFLRLSIMDVYKSSNTLISVVGRIETGIINVGKEVIIMPSRKNGIIESIYIHDNLQDLAFSGDEVLINLLNIDLSYLKPGDIICDLENPVQIVSKFRAKIITFDLSRPLIIGTPLIIYRGRLNVDGNIKKLISIIDKSTGQVKKKDPKFIGSFDAAIVEIEFCKQAEAMESFKHCKELGRFIARSQGETVAAGIIEDE
ncbi:hypothetical protein PNEG_03405 [Pneumocystis murina B123]|uniref:Elongation factor 1 alpha-like protein n=1 Tax=Pneumocystis murina (strain B123) TaxID=1069680 RepID=M7NM13_PNEMU|nr:hypothetical protein PNEG_03405 [Pneumocystis murina B123]EMR08237.1 hypothetical protein PNEG_03405 [Pneumocystis murina B123]